MCKLFRKSLLLCGLIVLTGAAGCRVQEIRSMYRKDFCSDGEISVEELGSERYEASGCNRRVLYQCVGGSCSQEAVTDDGEPDSEGQAQSEPVEDGPSSPTKVSATSEAQGQKGDARKLVLVADIRLDDRALLKLRTVPAQEGAPIQLTVVRMEREPELEQCSLEWMVNGQRLAAPKATFSRKGLLSALKNLVPRTVVQELGSAQQLAIRACDFRWSLSAEQLAGVREFVGRFEEELAWQGPIRKGGSGGRLAPSGGWPDWKVPDAAPAPVRTGDPLDAQALFKLLSPSVYQVEALLETGVSTGSAVAVSKTELLTNCHVVQGARKLVLKQNKRQLVAALGRSDPATDRCVLTVSDGGLVPVRGVRPYGDLAVGEPAYTLGTPAGLQLSLSNGILSGLREEAGRKYIQTTAPISPGSSGGGLFDARGNVIGITTMVLAGRERLNQALNFAIPADSFWAP